MKDWWDWTPRNAPRGLEKRPAEFWEDMYWKVARQLGNIQDQYLRFKGLEELNHKQAGMLMEKDLTIRQLKEELQMKENTAEVLPFRLGNSSEPPIDKDWLSKLGNGTRFLARQRASNTFFLEDFIVASDPKVMGYIFLGINLNTKEGGFKWVDPKKFSQAYEFCMTLEVIEIPDGNSNNVQTGRMVGNDQPEVVDGLHEEK